MYSYINIFKINQGLKNQYLFIAIRAKIYIIVSLNHFFGDFQRKEGGKGGKK